VPDPPPSAYTDGVVTPHAAFLALRYRPQQAMADLAALEAIPGVYGDRGFRDSVNVGTGHPSDGWLSLDQGMIMAAIANARGDDVIRRAFVGTDALGARVRPVLAVEEFNTQPRGCTVTGTAGPDRLVGTSGADVICGLAGDDRIEGMGGDDVLYGDDGVDRVVGGTGDDVLYGDDGDDRLDGGDGADVLAGGSGADRLAGDVGADHLEGGGGADRCIGDAADDAPGGC
jgi:Ca2+-binding RTX toxin-like protein